ncbi:MAG: hypothetical protein H6564_23805 [Lewinellaceae bacterium]|nr:hypothetical protein [Lewinellaceae bacterium]
MASPLNSLAAAIQSLETISEEERALLLRHTDRLNKELDVLDFALKRTQKDKSIVVNILKATIEDLEKSKLLLEESNRQLVFQQEELREQKRVIEENSARLDENLRKLEFSYKELEQFSYIASHDLKSPLRNIASFAQLLRRRYYGQLGQDANDYIDFIVSGAFQMSEVIQALLEYSMVGQDYTELTDADLNEVMMDIRANLRREIDDNRVTFLYKKLPHIKGIRASFIQLFQNLVSNAIKFRAEADPVIRICCKPRGNGWAFKVSDNGIGMDEAYQGKAFLPFQRLNGPDTPGTGIGLAICKKIVKMHKGEICYHSNPGAGTTFSFTLFPIDATPAMKHLEKQVG